MSSGDKKRAIYKRVVGLEYDSSRDDAPGISVKGIHFEADELVKIAKRFGIPIVEKKEVAQALDAFEEGQCIPEELYEAVAVILSNLEKQ